jgi:hypothetical protein
MRSTRRVISDAARISAADDKMGDAMRQRVGLARAGAGDDEQRPGGNARPHAVLSRAALFGIEFGEVIQARRHVKTSKKCGCPASLFLVLFARVLRVLFTLGGSQTPGATRFPA